MAVIGVKSITGITSITNAAGAADVLTFHSNNTTERARIDSSGRLLLGTATEGHAEGDNLTVSSSSITGITVRSGTSSPGNIFFSDGTSGNAERMGIIRYDHNGDYMMFGVNYGEKLRIDSAGNANITGITTAKGFVPTEGQLSHRNIIVNGAMTVAQRATSATTTTGGYHTVDRWRIAVGGSDEAPAFAQTDVTSGTPYEQGFRKAFKVINGNQTSGAGASDYIQLDYWIEAQDLATSGWHYDDSSSYITLSFWIKSSVAQAFPFTWRSEDGTSLAYNMTTGSLSANTWTKIVKKIPGNASLTIDNNSGKGMRMMFFPYIGTTYTTNGLTMDAWSGWDNAKHGFEQATTWWTTNDATYEITGLQLEVGSEATPFEHRSYGEELLRCQRYFWKPNIDNNLQPAYQYQVNYKMSFVPFPTTMRATPTATVTWGESGSFTTHNPNENHWKAYISSASDSSTAYYISTFEVTADFT